MKRERGRGGRGAGRRMASLCATANASPHVWEEMKMSKRGMREGGGRWEGKKRRERQGEQRREKWENGRIE